MCKGAAATVPQYRRTGGPLILQLLPRNPLVQNDPIRFHLAHIPFPRCHICDSFCFVWNPILCIVWESYRSSLLRSPRDSGHTESHFRTLDSTRDKDGVSQFLSNALGRLNMHKPERHSWAWASSSTYERHIFTCSVGGCMAWVKSRDRRGFNVNKIWTSISTFYRPKVGTYILWSVDPVGG